MEAIQIFKQDINQIKELNALKECLELRLALIGQNNSTKSEYEKNEDDIIRIKTQTEINKLKSIIVQKTFDVRDNLKSIEIEQSID